jgi:hypothetical protein
MTQKTDLSPRWRHLGFVAISVISSLLALQTLSVAQLTAQGQPAVGNSTGAALTTDPLFLDASQYAGADMCAKINAAYLALGTAGGVVDARAFQGPQGCNSNPFHGKNYSVVLLLGGVTTVTSVPWYTPQQSHEIRGIGGTGTVIQGCGPASSGWSSVTSNCTEGTVTVPQFPDATNTLSFSWPHGPFATGTYAALINDGGEGTSEGSAWNSDAFGGRADSLKLDCGGNNNCFGYYTRNEQERSGLFNVTCGDLGTGSACGFWDRMGANVAQSGPTHYAVRDVNMNANLTSDSASTYGLVFEGAQIEVNLTGGGGSGATAWVTGVSGGVISGLTLGYPGSSYTSAPTCTINTTASPTTVATCSTTEAGGVVTGISLTNAGAGYNNGLFGGGPDEVSNITMAGGANPGRIEDGVWLEGYDDPHLGYLHCEYSLNACLHFGGGSARVFGGFVHNIDTSTTVVNDVVQIGKGVDNNQEFISLSQPVGSQPTNMILDDQNGVTLTTSATNGGIQQYQPGGMNVWNLIRTNQSGNTDLAGTLTAATGSATYTFVGKYTSHPVCTATDETTTTSALKVTYTGTTSVKFTTPGAMDVVDYLCIGRN